MGTNWHLDDSFRLDWENQATIEGGHEFSISVQGVATPFSVEGIEITLEMEHDFELDVIHTVALDLIELVPEKFRQSPILQDYLEEAGLQLGNWLTSVRDIVKLLSPNTVASLNYLRRLGALIGVEFSPEDETTEAKTRKEITNAVDWYKLKGTYRSIDIMALIQEFTVNLYDMYTNDYTTFYLVDWFVGDENENPPGFDSSYYKSPHFGLEVLLNKVFETDSLTYLWETDYLDNLHLQVEKTRPAHIVPHYLLLLNPKTDEFGNIIEVDGEIKTKILGDWQSSQKFFDMVGSTNAWNFDDGTYFDQSEEGFLKSITKWVLGTGNYPGDLSGSFFSIENPVLTGTIESSDITIEEDKVTFEFIVPKGTQQDGISELGLYIPGTPDKLVVASIFPKIDKDDRVELRVVVEVFKTDLS